VHVRLVSTASHGRRTQRVDSADRASTSMASRACAPSCTRQNRASFSAGVPFLGASGQPVQQSYEFSLQSFCHCVGTVADGRGTRCVPCRQPSPVAQQRSGLAGALAVARSSWAQRENQMELHLRMLAQACTSVLSFCQPSFDSSLSLSVFIHRMDQGRGLSLLSTRHAGVWQLARGEAKHRIW
jgi:hypothetical protein